MRINISCFGNSRYTAYFNLSLLQVRFSTAFRNEGEISLVCFLGSYKSNLPCFCRNVELFQ